LQQLHTYGLLIASFRPQGEIILLRRYLRHRETLMQEAATCIQRIQKALTEMNLQMANVISDISGTTGLRILRAVVEGERDPQRLAAMRDWRIKATPDEVAKSLLGNWRDELIFVVGENLALYEVYQQKIERCDYRIEKPAKVAPETFLANWRDILASDMDPVVNLRSRIRAGFQGEVDGEHVAQLVTSISEYPTVAERLALRLAVQKRFGKLNALSLRVLNGLRTAFENEINYNSAEFSGYRAPRAIEDWVAEHAPNAPHSERDSWFRRSTVCLLEDSEPKTVVVGLVAASRSWHLQSRLGPRLRMRRLFEESRSPSVRPLCTDKASTNRVDHNQVVLSPQPERARSQALIAQALRRMHR
jgi:hypothetical protein